MTEQEWLQASDPELMLEFLEGWVSERKLRLFACACCRQFWHRLEDERARSTIETAEKFVDGLVPPNVLIGAYESCWDEERRTLCFDDDLHRAAAGTAYWRTAFGRPRVILGGFEAAQMAYRLSQEGLKPAWLLRDIFGNPFCSASIDSYWLTWHDGLLVSMARQMYDSRDFTDMPILADALEEAGCTDADILAHCRSGDEHVRGCWLVDLLLGKS